MEGNKCGNVRTDVHIHTQTHTQKKKYIYDNSLELDYYYNNCYYYYYQ